jgi:bZIP transcription factor
MEEAGSDAKRKRRLERNRASARESRQRKKEKLNGLRKEIFNIEAVRTAIVYNRKDTCT